MLYSSWSWWSWYGRPWLLKPAMRTRWGLSAPCACSFFSATARMCARADGGALPIRASAALAWFLSGIGNDRPGPAKVDAGSARRLAAVSLATYHFPPGPFRSSSPVFPRLRVAELPCATAPRCTRGYGGASASCMSAKWDAFDAVASYSGRMVGPRIGIPLSEVVGDQIPGRGAVIGVDASSVRLLGASPGRERLGGHGSLPERAG